MQINFSFQIEEQGQLVSIDAEGNKEIVIEGLDSPEGIAIKGGSIFVFEGNTGEIKEIKDNSISTIAKVNPGSNAQSKLQPPQWFSTVLPLKVIIYISQANWKRHYLE